jgi:glycosyltransferase involved in cell wall biosynthesis
MTSPLADALPRPRLSVALCTYNGGPFLQPQLDSLAAQTRPPDELVAFDDGSTDDTVDRLRRFAATVPFPVRVHAPADGLGPAKNFERAIAACTGDVIACCDQDDVWRADKLAVIAAAFARQPDLGFAFSDAEAIDASGNPLGYRLWDGVAFTPRLRRQVDAGQIFDVLVRYNVVTGATMAFASRLRPLVLPIGAGWMHDGWIALLVSAVAPAVAIAEPLISYRQHVDQAQGVPPRTLMRQLKLAWTMPRDQFAKEAAAYGAARDRLAMWPDAPRPAVEDLGAKARHYQTRSTMRLKRRSRLASVGEQLSGRYRRYALGWKSFAQDLFL